MGTDALETLKLRSFLRRCLIQERAVIAVSVAALQKDNVALYV